MNDYRTFVVRIRCSEYWAPETVMTLLAEALSSVFDSFGFTEVPVQVLFQDSRVIIEVTNAEEDEKFKLEAVPETSTSEETDV